MAKSKQTVYVTNGCSNHSDKERVKDDFYATPPIATEWLLRVEDLHWHIWEPACGSGHISNVLIHAGKQVMSTDIIPRGYGSDISADFLSETVPWDGDIVTNPPYNLAREFVEKAMELVTDGHKVCMLLKLTFMEGAKRESLFAKYPPKRIHVFSRRIACWANGIEAPYSSAVCYAWFVWEKGYTGDTVIRRIENK